MRGATASSGPTAARWPLRRCAGPPGFSSSRRPPTTAAAAAADGAAAAPMPPPAQPSAAVAARRLGLMSPQQQQQPLHHQPRPWPGGAGGVGNSSSSSSSTGSAPRAAAPRPRSRSASRSRGGRAAAPAPPPPMPAPLFPSSSAPKLPEAVDWGALPTGLAVTWLGTSSGAPSLHRNISCTVLRHRPSSSSPLKTAAAAAAARGEDEDDDGKQHAASSPSSPPNAFIVDAGEGSARQLSRTGVDLARVRAVFVTHLHGDHCFGLGSLAAACLCAQRAEAAAAAEAAGAGAGGGQASSADDPLKRPLLVVGPPGVHDLVAAQLLATGLMRSLLPDDDDDQGEGTAAAPATKQQHQQQPAAKPQPLLHVIELVELPGDAAPASPARAWRKHAAACALAGEQAASAVALERLAPSAGERADGGLRARLRGSSLVPPEQRRLYQQQAWGNSNSHHNNHNNHYSNSNHSYNSNSYNNGNGYNSNGYQQQAPQPPPQPSAGMLDADGGSGARPPPYTAKPGLVWPLPLPPGCGARVTAAQLQHRVPCWGYVWEEEAPRAAESEAGGGKAAAARRRRGGLLPHDAPAPPVGRKVVLLGDTVDSSALAPLAVGADLVAHEATFARGMEGKAAIAQHSTARMAGAFARAVGARRLVLTHFSARYDQAQAFEAGGGGGDAGAFGGRGGGQRFGERGGGSDRNGGGEAGAAAAGAVGAGAGAGGGGGEDEERAQRVAIDALRLEAAQAMVGEGNGGAALARVEAAHDFWTAHVAWPQEDAVESMR